MCKVFPKLLAANALEADELNRPPLPYARAAAILDARLQALSAVVAAAPPTLAMSLNRYAEEAAASEKLLLAPVGLRRDGIDRHSRRPRLLPCFGVG
jgi:hypothetical protein